MTGGASLGPKIEGKAIALRTISQGIFKTRQIVGRYIKSSGANFRLGAFYMVFNGRCLY
jgi:hypothetical protein